MHTKKNKTMQEYGIPYVELEPVTPFSFDIQYLTYTIEPDAYLEEPHRHNFQELIWIKTGKGSHVIDNVLLEIKPRMFYLIAQGQVHKFIQGIGLRGILIRFTDDFFFSEARNTGWDYHAALYQLFTVHQCLKIHTNAVAHFEAILQGMLHEYANKHLGWKQIVRHQLAILLIQLERVYRSSRRENDKPSPTQQTYNQFISLLENNFKNHHAVSFYAGTLCISDRQLSDIVRRFSGKTVKRLIVERIILEAKRYLQYTHVSSKELAFELGFSDPSYFNKTFKLMTGQTPGSYRP